MELTMCTDQKAIQSGIAQEPERCLAVKSSQPTKLNESAEAWERRACERPESKEDILRSLEALVVLHRRKERAARQYDAAESLRQKLRTDSHARE